MKNAVTFQDAFNLLCGDKLGAGIHREVFSCPLRPEYVVKVENGEGRFFANVLEMRFWHCAPDPVKMWLAPCEWLSPDGRLLLQKRVEPLSHDAVLPEKLPGFLNDFKRDNFGWYKGRLVCVDYAMVYPRFSMALQKVAWR